MNVKHKYDYYNRKEPSPIFLAKPGKRLYCALTGIDESNTSLKLRTHNTVVLSFTIDKYVDGELNKEYDMVDEYMELYCSGIWFRIMEPPTISNDGIRETKEVTAESYEIMLTQYTLKNFLINMGTEGSYEMMYQKEHDTSKFYQVKFYDPREEKLSFLHIVLAHANIPGWKIGYVDNITPDDEGVFLPDAVCNFEVEDKSVYAFLTQEASAAYKCIFEFDTVNMLINVYRPDSLGKDTNVVLGFRNIQDNITISRDKAFITQYYVDGLENYNIDMVNFKDNVITDLTYFTREPYMDKTLQDKYIAWSAYKESRRKEFADLSKEYNSYLETLTELMFRVPVDSAQNNWFGKKTEELKSAYDDNVAIIKGLEKLYVDKDNNFDLDALKKSPDWPLYESIMNYTLPAIVAALQAKGESIEGFGKGNVISCVNPVVMGDDWLYLGADSATFDTIQLDDSPAWGVTRGVKVTGSGGIRQKNISVEKTQSYVLSCYVRGSGTFNLEYGNTGQDRIVKSFNISSSTWQRVFISFTTGSKLIDVAFTGTDFTVCGMQLEMGTNPSQFGYFTQSENILKAYETDWKLYGISELKIKISTYEGCADELKKNGYAGEYNPLADYEEAYFTQMHQLYLDYLKLIEEAKAELDKRQAEYDDVKAKQDAVDEKRDKIVEDVDINNFGIIQNVLKGFTEKELYIIKSLCTQSTYNNPNIIVTSLDTTIDAVDKQWKLYKDAVDNLYVESHPQYIYEDTINNIYALPEFKEFHEELQVNNFVRVGLDDKKYVKLRVVEIEFNPMSLDENMDVTFSNMIQYKANRDDFTELIDEAGQLSNRGGGRVSSTNKSTTTDYVITADIIKQIFSNPLFGSMLGGSTVGGAGSGGSGTITADKIIAGLIKADEILVKKLTADTAFIGHLDATLINAEKIVTKILEADEAHIKELSAKIINVSELNADVANIKKLLAGSAGIGDLLTINLNSTNATIDSAFIKEVVAANITVADLMAHTASANEIVLISADGKRPTIAFKESTQQFYDSKGNVRVQIGQDGNGDFNFIVRGADGSTALFDSTGIKKEGIPANTIINEMIANKQISKDKIDFPIVETDEDGNISIKNILDGNGKAFGIEYTEFKDGITNQVKNIESKVDLVNNSIVDKIKEVVFDDKQNSINMKLSEVVQNLDGITQTVTKELFDADGKSKLDYHSTQIKQTADKLSLIATGDSESSLELTDKFIKLVSEHVVINADDLTVDALVTILNTATGEGHTKIDGGVIETSTVKAMLINANALQSNNYEADDSVLNDSPYSKSGTRIDLENGSIESKSFAIDQNGNAHFKGDGKFEGEIVANSGRIGGEKGFIIEEGHLYSGMDSLDSKNTPGVYIGTDGIALGGGKFKITPDGKVYAYEGEFRGKIVADSGSFTGTINATSGIFSGELVSAYITSLKGGKIGGFNITDNYLEGGNAHIGPDRLKYGENFIVSSDGTVTATNGNFSGTINATDGTFSGNITALSGTIGGFTINSDSLTGSNVTISPTVLKYGNAFNLTSEGYLTTAEGEIAGFKFTKTLNDKEHAYANTLYRIVNGDDGYDYQSGIKAASKNNGNTEAAFYVRKKAHSEASWNNSTLPFYVRNNGYVYAENLTFGQSLYTLGSYVETDENNITTEISKKIEVIKALSDKDILLGNIGGAGNSGSDREQFLHVNNDGLGYMHLSYYGYVPFEISMELESSGGNRLFSIHPNSRHVGTTLDATLGNSTYRWLKLYSKYVGDENTPTDFGYFKALYIPDPKNEGQWLKVGASGSGGSSPTYSAGTGINITSGKISVDTNIIASREWTRSGFATELRLSGNTLKLMSGKAGSTGTQTELSSIKLPGGTTTDRIVASNGNYINAYSEKSSVVRLLPGNSAGSIGNIDNPWDTGYFKKINIGSVNNFTEITDMFAAKNHSHSNYATSDHEHSVNKIKWNEIFGKDVHYKGFGHIHTIIMNDPTKAGSLSNYRAIALTNSSTPALIPYYFSNYSGVDNEYTQLQPGGTTDIGNPANHWNTLYVDNIVLGSETVIGSWGDISSGGASYTAGTGINISSNNVISVDTSTMATQSWVKSAFADTLSINGTTLSLLSYDGRRLSSVDLPSSGGGSSSTNILEYNSYSSQWIKTTDSASTYLVFRPFNEGSYKSYLGDNTYRWQKLNCRAQPNVSSDMHLKEHIMCLNNDFKLQKAFMDLRPVSYHFKYNIDDGECHYGFIAQEVERSFVSNGIDCKNLGLISKATLDKPNQAGMTTEYSLSYGEFTALNTLMTQKAHYRIDELKQENQSLTNSILQLQGEISILKQQIEEMKNIINLKAAN